MRLRVSLAALVLLLPAAALADKARKAAPPQPAASYPMHEAHKAEQVTVAAEPCDQKELLPDTRLKYAEHGILPIRVVVTNDSDDTITLEDARINFLAADNTVVHAASDEDLQRRMYATKGATGTRHTIPLPIPIPITTGKQHIDQKIPADMEDFGFATTTVKPHSTVSGYIFYDTSDLDQPVLAHATLELRKVRFAASNKALETFDIALHPSSAEEKKKDDENRK